MNENNSRYFFISYNYVKQNSFFGFKNATIENKKGEIFNIREVEKALEKQLNCNGVSIISFQELNKEDYLNLKD